jgi:hypothetical protein
MSFLESLFVRLPPPTGSGGNNSGGTVPQPLIIGSGSGSFFTATQQAERAQPSTLVLATRAYHQAVNPLVAGTEPVRMPPPDIVTHHGAPCAPHERIIQVARYGRIYKRKAPTHKIPAAAKASPPPGMQYCRFCEGYLPLSAFYTVVKRFVCKRHHAERKRNALKARCALDGMAEVIDLAMGKMHFIKDMLGYPRLDFEESALRSLLVHAGIPLGLIPCLLPIDPSQPLRPRNVAIVSDGTFRLIMRGYTHTCSRALYIAAVQHSNLLPPHLDPGRPDAPLHDPTYRRQNIDVGPLLLDELQAAKDGPPDCVDRTMMEALLHAEPRAAWLEHAESHVPLTIAMRARWGIHQKKLAIQVTTTTTNNNNNDDDGTLTTTFPTPKKAGARGKAAAVVVAI